jgi:Sec-independent protein translocase protein TatA
MVRGIFKTEMKDENDEKEEELSPKKKRTNEIKPKIQVKPEGAKPPPPSTIDVDKMKTSTKNVDKPVQGILSWVKPKVQVKPENSTKPPSTIDVDKPPLSTKNVEKDVHNVDKPVQSQGTIPWAKPKIEVKPKNEVKPDKKNTIDLTKTAIYNDMRVSMNSFYFLD